MIFSMQTSACFVVRKSYFQDGTFVAVSFVLFSVLLNF